MRIQENHLSAASLTYYILLAFVRIHGHLGRCSHTFQKCVLITMTWKHGRESPQLHLTIKGR